MGQIRRRCDEVGVTFLCTAMDLASADLLLDMDLSAVKVGSGDVNNWHLLEHLAAKKEVLEPAAPFL